MTYPLHPGQPGTPLRRHVEARHLRVGDVLAETREKVVRCCPAVAGGAHGVPLQTLVFVECASADGGSRRGKNLLPSERVWVVV